MRWVLALVGALLLGAVIGALVLMARGRDVVIAVGDKEIRIPRLKVLGPERPPIMKVIYLNRDGATLRSGADDSHTNRSSILIAYQKDELTVPKFAGSDKRWKEIVACIRKQYAPFDVEIVEERPAQRGYVMAVFGGTPGMLGAKKTVAGLAPFNGEPILDPVVLIFTRALKESARSTCETAAMEIAHTYGLDHQYTCRDPMGYLGGCGARFFQDKAYPCGEHKKRPCQNGQPTQNSVATLREILGPRVAAGSAPSAAAP